MDAVTETARAEVTAMAVEDAAVEIATVAAATAGIGAIEATGVAAEANVTTAGHDAMATTHPLVLVPRSCARVGLTDRR